MRAISTALHDPLTKRSGERRAEARDVPDKETASSQPKGFFSQPTPEQQQKALAYTGPESHGGESFKRGLQKQ